MSSSTLFRRIHRSVEFLSTNVFRAAASAIGISSIHAASPPTVKKYPQPKIHLSKTKPSHLPRQTQHHLRVSDKLGVEDPVSDPHLYSSLSPSRVAAENITHTHTRTLSFLPHIHPPPSSTLLPSYLAQSLLHLQPHPWLRFRPLLIQHTISIPLETLLTGRIAAVPCRNTFDPSSLFCRRRKIF